MRSLRADDAQFGYTEALRLLSLTFFFLVERTFGEKEMKCESYISTML